MPVTCSPAEYLDTRAPEHVADVFSTLGVYHDSGIQRSVRDVLWELLQNEIFMKSFAGALVKRDAAKATKQVLPEHAPRTDRQIIFLRQRDEVNATC
jgi:hypothetical protein